MPVRMELSRILIRELNDYQLIELREVVTDEQGETSQAEEGRSFPIAIGLPEAHAIERRLKGITIKRPQTHDLLANIVKDLGARLQSISITDLTEGTFFATLDIRKENGELIHIDSRPSDAIALGIAGGVPILVAEHVLESAMREGPPQP